MKLVCDFLIRNTFLYVCNARTCIFPKFIRESWMNQRFMEYILKSIIIIHTRILIMSSCYTYNFDLLFVDGKMFTVFTITQHKQMGIMVTGNFMRNELHYNAFYSCLDQVLGIFDINKPSTSHQFPIKTEPTCKLTYFIITYLKYC